ncbi:MAG TPA: hypothetical protein VGB48_05725 [Allosphingosinicella sp.]|jgi:hypothetical protein
MIRVGLWLLFLIGSLSLPLAFFAGAPIAVGTGQLRVLGWGALIGAGIGLAVRLSYASVLAPASKLKRVVSMIGAMCLGAFGGVGAAGLIDGYGATPAGVVELPVVSVEQAPGRRGRRARIVTLDASDPTREDAISLHRLPDALAAAVRPGRCLFAHRERGRFGSLWISKLEADRCSPIRGRPSTHVIVLDRFSTWRWHNPSRPADGAKLSITDDALPPELVCRTHAGAWLYQCALRSGEACLPRPRAWPHAEPALFGTGIGGLIFHEIEVRADGALTFNGDEVDTQGLQGLLALAEQIQPTPPLVLRTTLSSDCAAAERVRAMLDKQPMCRTGSCFESTRWQELGFPTFQENQNRFAHSPRRRR